jgi:hypothetical protein
VEGRIDTQVCCQDAGATARAHGRGDDPGHVAYYDECAYIEFFDAEDASIFLTVLANEGPRGKFYDRMSHWSCPGAWRKTISFYDGDFRPWSRSEYRKFEPSSVKIAFPVTDIKEIVRRLRRHNRAAAEG